MIKHLSASFGYVALAEWESERAKMELMMQIKPFYSWHWPPPSLIGRSDRVESDSRAVCIAVHWHCQQDQPGSERVCHGYYSTIMQYSAVQCSTVCTIYHYCSTIRLSTKTMQNNISFVQNHYSTIAQNNCNKNAHKSLYVLFNAKYSTFVPFR